MADTPISVYLDKETKAKLKKIAKQEDRPVSNLASRIIKEALKQWA